MSPGLQAVLVALVVLASALSVLRRCAPRLAWRAQARVSYWLEGRGRHVLIRRLGAALRPSLAATTGACGTACSTCGSCNAPSPVTGL